MRTCEVTCDINLTNQDRHMNNKFCRNTRRGFNNRNDIRQLVRNCEQQARQNTHNVTLRRVGVTIITTLKQYVYIFWVSVCSLRYPAWNACAPYCHLWSVWLYKICPRYLTNGKIFEKKKVTEHKMRVVISTNLSEIFFTLRRNEQDNIINVYWSSCKVPVIIVRLLMKQEFSRQFRKILKY